MNRARVLAISDKEVRYILRDWRSLAVTLLLPIVLLVLFGYAINFDVKGIRLAVYDPNGTRESRDLIDELTRTGHFRLVEMLPRPQDGERALQTRAAKVVLILPRGLSEDMASGRRASVQTLIDGSDSLTATVSLSYLEAILRNWALKQAKVRLPRHVALVPIEPQVRVWYNEDLSSANFITPGLVVVLLMMLAALLTSQTVVREREQGTIEGLVVLPVSAGEIIVGKLLPYVGIALVDVVLVAAAGKVLFHVAMRGSLAVLAGLTVIYLFAALGAGLLISVTARSQQVAYMIALIATLLPTFLLTGFVFPISSMPKVLQLIVQVHPATHFLVITRSIVLKGAGLSVLWPRALALVVIAAALLAASIGKFKKEL